MPPPKRIAIIGGGASGFFAGLQCKARAPEIDVAIFEKSTQVLSKVKISGGGRCNLTHHCQNLREFIQSYPRGSRELRGVFHRFGPLELVDWWNQRGIELHTEEDGRIFPGTNSSQTVVDCLVQEAENAGIAVSKDREVKKIHLLSPSTGRFSLEFSQAPQEDADSVLVATGGCPRSKGLEWLCDLGHTIELPVASLFTFNIPHPPLRALMGLSVPRGTITIPGLKRRERGPLLLTHWGLSGPGVLKFSAWEARELARRNYHFPIQINWLGISSEEEIRKTLLEHKNSARQISTSPLFGLPKRLWKYFLDRTGISPSQKWAELSKKNLHRLIKTLVQDSYEVEGKTTFKDEFVTCGGVALKEVNFKTMESKVVAGLYFSGEVLDLDGITGGFNLQAAWSTGWLAGDSMAMRGVYRANAPKF